MRTVRGFVVALLLLAVGLWTPRSALAETPAPEIAFGDPTAVTVEWPKPFSVVVFNETVAPIDLSVRLLAFAPEGDAPLIAATALFEPYAERVRIPAGGDKERLTFTPKAGYALSGRATGELVVTGGRTVIRLSVILVEPTAAAAGLSAVVPQTATLTTTLYRVWPWGEPRCAWPAGCPALPIASSGLSAGTLGYLSGDRGGVLRGVSVSFLQKR